MPLSPFGDKALQSSATTTTGAYQVTTNVGAFKTWRSQFATLSEVFYYAENSDASIWEEGFGTLTYGSPDTISRATVFQSSTGSNIDWTGVTVYIFSAPVARAIPGRYVTAKTMWVPENRRPTTAVGAGNKTIAAADVGGIFTLDNAAATRSVTLPAISAVGEGFSFKFMGLSNATVLSLIPNGSEAIDFSSGGTTVKLPGKIWIEVWADGSQWRTSYPYGQRTKLLEFAPSAAASVDTTGSIIPSWVNTLDIEWELTVSSDGANLGLQMYDSGGSLKSAGSDYYHLFFATGSGGATNVTTATSSAMALQNSVDNSSTQGSSGFVTCKNLQGGNHRASFMGMGEYLDSGGTLAQHVSWGARQMWAGPSTGFKIFPSAGTVTGNVRAYASA